MFSRSAIALLALASIALAGCSSTGGKVGSGSHGPDYAERVSAYPESDYLRAVGTGQSEPEARKRAVSELSRIFVSRIKSEAVDTVRSVMVDRKDERLEETLFSRIEILSEIELEGVEVPEIWKEEATFYALAVLERQKAARGFNLKIEDIDSRIEGELISAQKSASRLLRYRSLSTVASLWAERTVYMSRLNVLGFSAPLAGEGGARGAIRDLAELRGSMRIFLDISGSSTLASGVAESLGKAGFILAPSRESSDVVISGEVEVRNLDIDVEDWKYVRATVSLSVEDPVSGESVGEVSDSVRSAHVSYSEATGKAIRGLVSKVSQAIIDILDK